MNYPNTQASLPRYVYHIGVKDELDDSFGFSRHFRGLQTEGWLSLMVRDVLGLFNCVIHSES